MNSHSSPVTPLHVVGELSIVSPLVQLVFAGSCGHSPSPGLQAVAVGHAVPVPVCAVISFHVLSLADSHAEVQALQVPVQLVFAGSIQLPPEKLPSA